MESPEQMVERFANRMKEKFGLDLTAVERYEFIKEITKRDKLFKQGEE